MNPVKAGSRLLLLTVLTILGGSLTYAQSLKIGLQGGSFYLASVKSSSGIWDVYTNPKGGFGFGPWEPWVGLEVRYSPPRGRITLVADASYSWLSGNGTIDWVESQSGSQGGTSFQSDLYIVSGGAQWELLSGPVRPYLGLRFQWTYLTPVRGDEWATAIGRFDGFGVGLLGGTAIDLSSSIAVDAFARYNFANIGHHGEGNPYFNCLFVGAGLLFEVL